MKPFPTLEELRKEYKEVMENEAVTAISNWYVNGTFKVDSGEES